MDTKARRALTALDVRKLPAGMYLDAEVKGLYLRVLDTGSRGFLIRYMIAGRRRDMWLGSTRELTLAQAREEAREARTLIRQKLDPLVKRRAEHAENMRQAGLAVWTFKKAAEAVHEALRPGWKNPKHADQWINTLATYAFPKIGERPVGEIMVADMIDVLRPIWIEKQETARRVRQRLDAVMRWAVAHGYAAANPVDAATELLPKQKRDVEHHPAMPHADLPAFVNELCNAEPAAGNFALLFTILTAARSGEVRSATWSEIDTGTGTWTIPADRMKAGREHRVPLPGLALRVLQLTQSHLGGSGLIFPGPRGKPLSDATMAAALKRRGLAYTVHGFRSSFRDWCAENGVSGELAERALAHGVKDQTEGAYHRTVQLERRRPLMRAWGQYLEGEQPDIPASIQESM